jgi:hypothetical protein
MLVRGGESKDRVMLFVSLTGITSIITINALTDFLCTGHSRGVSASRNGVIQQNFSRDIKKLNKVAGVVDGIKEIDWAKLIEYRRNQYLEGVLAAAGGLLCLDRALGDDVEIDYAMSFLKEAVNGGSIEDEAKKISKVM